MCGIAGAAYLNHDRASRAVMQRMTRKLAHRGPDGEGIYVDGPVGLGHRRLAIIDLSPAGAQPMGNEDGTIVLTYNGEIYDFQTLRRELQSRGHHFRSATDSEIILHAYEEWGEACVERFNGIFAFALWDRPRRRLLLARDRHGVKPLYWYARNGVLVFASEIKAILEHPDVPRQVCLPALSEYFTFQNIFTDLTLFEHIKLLPAGCLLELDLIANRGPTVKRYWSYPAHSAQKARCSEEDSAGQIRELLGRAVQRQTVSDAPVGSYLSGGIDSAAIASLAAPHVEHLRTFTAGFDLTSASGPELGFDERRTARMMAKRIRSEHHEMILQPDDMEAVLPELVWHLEDLRVGQSYPNYCVARFASKHVKVVLCGVGSDELFAGYPWRYPHGPTGGTAADFFQRYYGYWQRLLSEEEREACFLPVLRRAAAAHPSFDVFRGVFRENWDEPKTPADCLAAALHFECKTFLHGLLVVEDKLSMAHSLESRVPFLDNELVDFALRLPVWHKLGAWDEDSRGPWTSEGKKVLRRAVRRLIPSRIRRLPKQGFSGPDASWFRTESRSYVHRLLRNPNAEIYQYFDRRAVGSILDEHGSGRANRRLLIWSLLCMEWWLRQFISGDVEHRPMPTAEFAVPANEDRAEAPRDLSTMGSVP